MIREGEFEIIVLPPAVLPLVANSSIPANAHERWCSLPVLRQTS